MKRVLDKEKFSKAVKYRRIFDLNIDLREVSSQTGLSIGTLSRIENGRSLDIDNFATLCNWLGVPADTFFKTVKVKKEKPIKQ